MSDKKVIEGLKELLASSYMLLLKTHNYHWNVTGPQFISLHKMFEEQYDDLFEAVDDVAERIRALGVKAPATFKEYLELSVIEEGDENASAVEMLKDLSDSNKKLSQVSAKVIVAAQDAGDEVSMDLSIQRQTVHDKNAWMLDSSV